MEISMIAMIIFFIISLRFCLRCAKTLVAWSNSRDGAGFNCFFRYLISEPPEVVFWNLIFGFGLSTSSIDFSSFRSTCLYNCLSLRKKPSSSKRLNSCCSCCSVLIVFYVKFAQFFLATGFLVFSVVGICILHDLRNQRKGFFQKEKPIQQLIALLEFFFEVFQHPV